MNKRSLVDIIPQNIGLHSAILTTFSLDYCFLENLVGKLRRKGIINIMVLADGVMVDASSGAIRAQPNIGKTYSVLGYPTKNVFHSKVQFFIGKEKAMMTVGSGNLTIPGFGKNAENFNYILFDGPEDHKINLLNDCWEYLKSKLSLFDLSALSQLETIKKEASWLETLVPVGAPTWVELGDDTSVAFIANNPVRGTLQQITELIPPAQVDRITIMAPFHNHEGSIVTHLAAIFNGARIRMVLQDNFGQLPLGMAFNEVEIYDYKDILANRWGQAFPPHFHAKLYIFEGRDFNFIYSGSANASQAGFGYSNKKEANEEVGLLWKKQPFDIEEHYGFDFSVATKPLSAFKVLKQDSGPTSDRQPKEYFIKSATWENGKLRLILDRPLKANDNMVRVYDHESAELANLSATIGQSISMSTESINHNDICFTAIINKEGIAVSGRQVVQHLAELRKTNPSEGNQLKVKAEEAMAAGMFDDPVILEAIISLLESNEANKKKRATLAKKKANPVGDNNNESRNYSREEIDQAIKEHQLADENNVRYEKELLESITAAMINFERSFQESEQEAEADLNDNPDKPSDNNPKEKPAVSRGEFAKKRNQLARIWKTSVMAGKSLLDRDSVPNTELFNDLQSINIALFTFFGYVFNSYSFKDGTDHHPTALYPEYGPLSLHESRFSIFLSLCGTALNIMPHFQSHPPDRDFHENKISLYSYLLFGICLFWEADENKQTEINTRLLEIFMNLRFFITKEEWKEIDLQSLLSRINMVNHEAIAIAPDRLISIPELLIQKCQNISQTEFHCHPTLGYFKIEDFKPMGDVNSANGYLLSRAGFPYLVDVATGLFSYKRWYSKKTGQFYEGTKKTIAGYDKRKKI